MSRVSCEINGIHYDSIVDAMSDLGLSRYKVNKILASEDGAYGYAGSRL